MVAKSNGPGIKSVTIIKQDVVPNAGAAVQASARQARFLSSVALLTTPVDVPDKAAFDVTETQTHTFELEVTSNPIQNGSTITDHSRRLPEVFECVGFFTDTPLVPPQPIQIGRSFRQWTKLKSFFDAREPVFIATAIRIYPSMLIRRMSVTRDSNTGAIMRVGLFAQEIRIAESLVEVPFVDEAAGELLAAPVVNGGTQVPVPI